jgi:tRNA uridine 5-carbamoylmethylation protein Kti12
VQIWCKCSLEEALRRNAQRLEKDRVPENVVIDMWEKFEQPNSKKFHWEKNTIYFDTEDNAPFPVEELESYARNVIKHSVMNNQPAKNEKSFLNMLDMATRKQLSSFLQRHPSEIKDLGKRLNDARRQFFLEQRDYFVDMNVESVEEESWESIIQNLVMYMDDIFEKERKYYAC